MAKRVTLAPDLRQILSLLLGHDIGLPVSRRQRQRQRPTLAGTAAAIRSTPHAVRRVLKAFKEGGLSAVKALRWTRGRPKKEDPISGEDWQWATDKGTLYAQVGLTLKARALMLSNRVGRSVKPWELRRLYRMSGVTQQRLSHRHGPLRGPAPSEEQEQHIRWLQAQVNQHLRLGFEVVQVDECTFSPHKYNNKHWAPAGQPLCKESRWAQGGVVAVLGGVSMERGKVHFKYKQLSRLVKGYSGEDVRTFLHELRKRIPASKKVVVFMDMAGTHCTQALWRDVMGGALNLSIIYNLPYRPDFYGIEAFWAAAKKDYRNRFDWIKANGRQWVQAELIQQCIEAVSDETAKRLARAGWIRLFKGQPVVPLERERMPFPGDPVP